MSGPTSRGLGLVTAVALLLFGMVSFPTAAGAAATGPLLGTASAYSVLGATTVTNTGRTLLGGNLGVSPGTAITGFPPGHVLGATHAGDAAAAQARSDLVLAYDDAAGRAPTGLVSGDLVGLTFPAGVYKSASTLELSGTVTLDGAGDPDATFIFQIGSSLTTASNSTVALINGAQACNVFWQVGSSAILGTRTSFRGTIMALTSITVATGAIVDGRALARNGQVSLDTNTFSSGACAADTTTTTTSGGATTTTAATTPGGGAVTTAPGAGSSTGLNRRSGAPRPPQLARTGISLEALRSLVSIALGLILLGAVLVSAARPYRARHGHRRVRTAASGS